MLEKAQILASDDSNSLEHGGSGQNINHNLAVLHEMPLPHLKYVVVLGWPLLFRWWVHMEVVGLLYDLISIGDGVVLLWELNCNVKLPLLNFVIINNRLEMLFESFQHHFFWVETYPVISQRFDR